MAWPVYDQTIQTTPPCALGDSTCTLEQQIDFTLSDPQPAGYGWPARTVVSPVACPVWDPRWGKGVAVTNTTTWAPDPTADPRGDIWDPPTHIYDDRYLFMGRRSYRWPDPAWPEGTVLPWDSTFERYWWLTGDIGAGVRYSGTNLPGLRPGTCHFANVAIKALSDEASIVKANWPKWEMRSGWVGYAEGDPSLDPYGREPYVTRTMLPSDPDYPACYLPEAFHSNSQAETLWSPTAGTFGGIHGDHAEFDAASAYQHFVTKNVDFRLYPKFTTNGMQLYFGWASRDNTTFPPRWVFHDDGLPVFGYSYTDAAAFPARTIYYCTCGFPPGTYSFSHSWIVTFNARNVALQMRLVIKPGGPVVPPPVERMHTDTYNGVTATAWTGETDEAGVRALSVGINRGISGKERTGAGSADGWQVYPFGSVPGNAEVAMGFLPNGRLVLSTYIPADGGTPETRAVWINDRMGDPGAWVGPTTPTGENRFTMGSHDDTALWKIRTLAT